MEHAYRDWAFDELTAGQVFDSAPHVVTVDEIISFSKLLGETNPLHTDPEFAAASPFKTVIASGSFGLALTIALIDAAEPFHATAIAALGIDEWRYLAPVIADMTVRSRMVISALRPWKGDLNTGVVARSFELYDTSGRLIQRGSSPIIVATRANASQRPSA